MTWKRLLKENIEKEQFEETLILNKFFMQWFQNRNFPHFKQQFKESNLSLKYVKMNLTWSCGIK